MPPSPAEPTEESTHVTRRANWVALRTLRQRVNVVGRTTNGGPVFEAKSVRLILRGKSNHFTRLVPCSKCGRDVPGSQMLVPADLDRSPSPVICAACVKRSTPSGEWRREERRSATPPVEEPPAAVVDEELPGVDRVELLEAQVQAAMMQLAQLAESARRGQAETVNRSALEAAVGDALAEARAETASSSQAIGARVAAFEGQVRQGLQELAKLVDAQRSDMAALAESQRDLAQAQEPPPDAAAEGVLPEKVEEVRTELAALVESGQAELRQALIQDVTRARVEAAEREQQVQHGMSRLSAMVADLRSDLKAEIAATVRSEVPAVVQAEKERWGVPPPADLAALAASVDDIQANTERLAESQSRLVQAQDQLEERLAEVVARPVPEARVEATEREQQVQHGMSRLSAMVADLRRDFRGEIAATVRSEVASLAEAEKERWGAPPASDLTALAGSVDDIQATAERLAESQRQLVQAHEQLEERLAEVAARPASDAVEEVQRELAALVESGRAELREALAQGLAGARVEATGRDQQVQHGMSRLSAMVADLRKNMEAAIAATVRSEVASLAEAQKELWGTHAAVDRRIEDLQEQGAETAASVEHRLHALEERMQEAVYRLAEELEAHRRETAQARDPRHLAGVAERLERLERRLAELEASRPREAVASPAAGSLLDALDAQLRASEGRLELARGPAGRRR